MTLRIKLVVTDVDGVLTDGSINIDADGREFKRFHVWDGSAIANLRHLGIETAIVSGRHADATTARAKELRIDECHQGHHDKLAVLRDISARRGIDLAEMAFIGDDLLDLRALLAVGLSASPADGRPEVRARVQIVTAAAGGRGAFREFAEHIIREMGLWDALMARYLDDPR